MRKLTDWFKKYLDSIGIWKWFFDMDKEKQDELFDKYNKYLVNKLREKTKQMQDFWWKDNKHWSIL